PCRFCFYWHTSGELQRYVSKYDIEKRKMKWLDFLERSFGRGVEIAYLDNAPIGFMQYASAKHFPRIDDYVSGPPSDDAVFIACLYIINKENRRKGYGTIMLQKILKELGERNYRVVETFARLDSENNPSGPLAFYLKNGFEVVRQKDNFPLVRLKL
ncbi:MAG: GNAT family N-acetyltransferase, partial [Candidatus Bathyarchaeia archaeon]